MHFLFMVSLHLSPLSLTFYIFLSISNFSCALWGRTPSLPPNVYLHLFCFFSPSSSPSSLFICMGFDISVLFFSKISYFECSLIIFWFPESPLFMWSPAILPWGLWIFSLYGRMNEESQNMSAPFDTANPRDIDQSWNHLDFGANMMDFQTSSNLWVQISVRRIFQMNVRKIRNFYLMWRFFENRVVAELF